MTFYSEVSEIRALQPTVGVFLELGGDRDEYGREGVENDRRWNPRGAHPGMRGFGYDDG